MNTHHQTFLLEYYRTGDKKQAYRKAYPKTKDSNLTNSVNRLMARTDIAEVINEYEQTKHKDAEAEIAARYSAELIGFYEAQVYLTKIIRGQLTTTKQIKLKDRLETIEVPPSISEILRALNTYFRLNNHYPKQQQNTTKRNSTAGFPIQFPLQGAEGFYLPSLKELHNPIPLAISTRPTIPALITIQVTPIPKKNYRTSN